MRYIDIRKIERLLSQEQKNALKDAASEVQEVFSRTETLLGQNPDATQIKQIAAERRAAINNHSDLWSNIKGIYEDYFYKKCWYTESLNPGSSKDMDHFRPKLEVYENDSHPGYWWLAFEWRNYRFSCQYSNRLKKNPETKITGGKGSHFPLAKGSFIATKPEHDYRNENFILLDPCSPGDYKLLSFDENGKPIINPQFENDANAIERVEKSIEFMNLDFPAFNEERCNLFYEIKDIIENADREFRNYMIDKEKNYCSLVSFKSRLETLEEKRDKKSAYSRAAEIYISYFKDYEWVERYLFM